MNSEKIANMIVLVVTIRRAHPCCLNAEVYIHVHRVHVGSIAGSVFMHAACLVYHSIFVVVCWNKNVFGRVVILGV